MFKAKLDKMPRQNITQAAVRVINSPDDVQAQTITEILNLQEIHILYDHSVWIMGFAGFEDFDELHARTIHDQLAQDAQSTVARYLPRPRKPPSQTWRTFLTNHLAQTVAIDFFTVPTATFRILFVFVVLSHHRRRVLHFGVTEHPTQEWTIQQMREASPWEQPPKYVLRDRDAIYGSEFATTIRDMGMEQVLSAPRSPWQNPYVERLVGSIRRECLDHVIVWNRRSLHRILQNYFAYYQSAYALILGQRRARTQSRGTAGTGACGRTSAGRRVTPPIPATRGVIAA